MVTRRCEGATEDMIDLATTPRNDVLVREQVDEVTPMPSSPGVSGSRGSVHRFEIEHGPFDYWRRTVEVSPSRAGGALISETIEAQSALRMWSMLFDRPMRALLRGGTRPETSPWWLPAERLSGHQSRSLEAACALSVVLGYAQSMSTRVLTFAADEFGNLDSGAQGTVLSVIRLGVVASMILMSAADRMGRARLITWTSWGALIATASTALSPGIVSFTIFQLCGRNLANVAVALVAITVAEELPAGTRAFGVAVQGMSYALGAGFLLLVYPVADLNSSAWRLVCLAPLVLIPVARASLRQIPETARFEAHMAMMRGSHGNTVPSETAHTHSEPAPRRANPTSVSDVASAAPVAGALTASAAVSDSAAPLQEPAHAATVEPHGGHFSGFRLAALALIQILLWAFGTPSSQFQSDYLNDVRHYDALLISVFLIATNLPSGVGVVVGGRLGDRIGRRPIALAGFAGLLLQALLFVFAGPAMWGINIVSALIGAMLLPTLGTYGPELFPTAKRGFASAVLTVSALLGGIAGLQFAGRYASSGGYGEAMMWLTIPAALAMVVFWLTMPETAGLELEELNPGDAAVDAALL